MSDAEHVQELVRTGDRDRFLASLFAPDDARPALLALYAFNLEIGRIAASVSEPQLGLIRQQWWLDTLDAIFGRADVPGHPVAQELARAVEQGGLPKHALRNLVMAREFDLYSDPMPDMQGLEAYLGETSSALIQMASLVLVGPQAALCAEAAGLAGVAHGLALLLNAGDSGHLPPDLIAGRGPGPCAAAASGRARACGRSSIRRLAGLPAGGTDRDVSRRGLAQPAAACRASPVRPVVGRAEQPLLTIPPPAPLPRRARHQSPQARARYRRACGQPPVRHA